MSSSPIGAKPELSIVVPCFNEELVLEETARRLLTVMTTSGRSFEIVFVDDGSKDATASILRQLQASDRRIRMVRLSRNFGHQIASTAGLHHAQGKAVVLIDADLQDPPEVILQMIERWAEGYDVVYATRNGRSGETTFKLKTAKWFYRLINRLSDIPIPLDTGDFRLMDRKVVDVLLSMPERDRFLRGMVSWVGFSQISVSYDRAARRAGTTKYPVRKMVRFALDGILSFSILPLRLATLIGLGAAGLGLLGSLVVVLIRLLAGQWVGAWTGVLLAVLFMGGAQLICLGILGEYLGRIYGESKRRPLYIVQETRGFGEPFPHGSKSVATRSQT
jgi:glycosyltransferase involved in cell wall biosynthesis